MTSSDQTGLLEDLQLFHGPVSPMRAELYARLPSLDPAAGYQLEGEVAGPLTASTRTLPARGVLLDAGPGPTLLARSIVPDPCPWTAEVPAVYRVRVNLSQHGRLLESAERMTGFRNLGVNRGQLIRSGQPWMLRGLAADAVGSEADGEIWRWWRESELALVAIEPSGELCAAASREGVPIVAVTGASGDELKAKVHGWARWVSVAAVLVLADSDLTEDPHTWAPNLLFATRWHGRPQASTPTWCDLLVCAAERLVAGPDGGEPSTSPLARIAGQTDPPTGLRRVPPILVSAYWRSGSGREQALTALQCLERTMAPSGPHAGYLLES